MILRLQRQDRIPDNYRRQYNVSDLVSRQKNGAWNYRVLLNQEKYNRSDKQSCRGCRKYTEKQTLQIRLANGICELRAEIRVREHLRKIILWVKDLKNSVNPEMELRKGRGSPPTTRRKLPEYFR